MAVRWLVVVIVGCVALAVCVAVVLLNPVHQERRRLRPLANVDRLTRLPEYVRAVRLRALIAVVTLGLLLVAFACTVLAAARPTGLPTATGDAAVAQPEDIMLCFGRPMPNGETAEAARFFAAQAQTFGTQRIGLTSTNSRVIPLTRDYAHVTDQLSKLAGDDAGLVAPVAYVDYTEGVQDLLALCMTGFPSFEDGAAQRRSIVYVGIDEPSPGTALFDTDRVRRMADTAGVQINALTNRDGTGTLCSLARHTGGQCFTGDLDVGESLTRIRSHPPAPTEDGGTRAAVRAEDSPDIPLVVALLAAVALAIVPVLGRYP